MSQTAHFAILDPPNAPFNDGNGTHLFGGDQTNADILLMEEIPHHLTCMKPCKYIMGYSLYQTVQDFFHLKYLGTPRIL